MQNLHRPVSNRGQWPGTLTIYADGLPDPSQTTFVFSAWPTEAGHGYGCDYGRHGAGLRGPLLQARTDDETGRLVAAANGNSIAVTWLFPAVQMFGFSAGSYEGSISAIVGDEMSEIEAFRFVVRTRGSADRLRPSAPPTGLPLPPYPPPLPPTAELTPEAVAALLPKLPTTLPALPGLPWNNGGFLSWS